MEKIKEIRMDTLRNRTRKKTKKLLNYDKAKKLENKSSQFIKRPLITK